MSDEIIKSRQNQRVKNAAKLRDRRQREKQGRFLIDGVREIGRAHRAGIRFDEVFFCAEFYASDEATELLTQLRAGATPVFETSPDVFTKLAFGDRHEGIVAAAACEPRQLKDFHLPDSPLVVVLEAVEKPGNVGAVLRTADAAGVSAVVVAGPSVDLYNPNTIRASLGTIFTVPVCTAKSDAALAWLRGLGLKMLAARVDANLVYTEADYRGGTAMILGSEAEGLSSHWNQPDVTPIALPMRGIADSLNVSATAAVLCYEALKQRMKDEG